MKKVFPPCLFFTLNTPFPCVHVLTCEFKCVYLLWAPVYLWVGVVLSKDKYFLHLALHCTAMHCNTQYCTPLHLHCTALHSTMQSGSLQALKRGLPGCRQVIMSKTIYCSSGWPGVARGRPVHCTAVDGQEVARGWPGGGQGVPRLWSGVGQGLARGWPGGGQACLDQNCLRHHNIGVKLARVSLIDNRPSQTFLIFFLFREKKNIFEAWHVTGDTWHVTHDTWHMVLGGHSLKISAL